MDTVDSARNARRASLSQHRGLADLIAERLRVEIVEGELEGGTSISEVAIAEDFGTSRTPVREALRLLEKDGVVSIVPKHGAFVTEVTAEDLTGNYVLRAYLYGLAARLVATFRTKKDMSQLELLIRAMESEIESENWKAYLDLLGQFNDALARCSNLEYIDSALRPLRYPALRVRYQSVQLPGRVQTSYKLYCEIFDAVVRQDALRAEQSIRQAIILGGLAVLTNLFGQDEDSTSLKTLKATLDD